MPQEKEEIKNSKEPEMRVRVVEESQVESKPQIKENSSLSGGDNVSSYSNVKRFADGIPFWILLIAFLIGLTLGGGLVGGMFYFKTNVTSIPETLPTPSPTLTPALEEDIQPTPIPEEIDLTTYKIMVLNGTGKPGEAGAVQDLLTTSGFENIETDNAANFKNKATLVEVKENVSDQVIEKIKASLIKYDIEISSDYLDKENELDIQITAGSSRV